LPAVLLVGCQGIAEPEGLLLWAAGLAHPPDEQVLPVAFDAGLELRSVVFFQADEILVGNGKLSGSRLDVERDPIAQVTTNGAATDPVTGQIRLQGQTSPAFIQQAAQPTGRQGAGLGGVATEGSPEGIHQRALRHQTRQQEHGLKEVALADGIGAQQHDERSHLDLGVNQGFETGHVYSLDHEWPHLSTNPRIDEPRTRVNSPDGRTDAILWRHGPPGRSDRLDRVVRRRRRTVGAQQRRRWPMIKVKGKSLPKVRVRGDTLERVEGSVVAEGLDAESDHASLSVAQGPVALAALRQALVEQLRSTGGRPSLGASRRQKIPLHDADWELMLRIANLLTDGEIRPTPGQVASELLRQRLREVEDEIEHQGTERIRGMLAGPRSSTKLTAGNP
jgi:hypothetical protein